MLDALIQTAGRSHMMLLHFPIGLVLLGVVLELLGAVRGRRVKTEDGFVRRRSPVALWLVGLGGVAAAVSAATGWVYAWQEFEGVTGDLDLHRWIAIVGAGLALLAFVVGMSTRGRAGRLAWAYRGVLVASAGLIGWAGHLGGELVHGEGFVFAPIERALAARAAENVNDEQAGGNAEPDSPSSDADPVAEDPIESESGETDPIEGAVAGLDGGLDSGLATGSEPVETGEVVESGPLVAITPVSFETQIGPIFETNCVRCHRDGKARGKVRLDALDEVMLRVVAGDADASRIVQVIELGEFDDLHMPKDEPSLPAETIGLIRSWIDGIGGDEPEPVALSVEPEAALAEAAPIELTDAQRAARDSAIELLRSNRIAASVRAAGVDDVEVRVFEGRGEFGDDDLALLAGLEPCLTVLDMAGTSVTDAGVAGLAGFTRLRTVRLGETAVTDAGLAALAACAELERIDLHQTAITGDGLEPLLGLERLRAVRAWGSAVTEEQAADLRERFPVVRVDLGG